MLSLLKPRFYLLITIIFVAVALSSWLFSMRVIDSLNFQWAKQFTQLQVQVDKHRTLTPLTREIALARQLAVEPALQEMARNEDSPAALNNALAVLERYRPNFRDQSYFFALAESGNYYYNDANNRYAKRQLRYRLSPSKPADQWFYASIKKGKPYQVNIDPDANLGVTKVWINVLVMDAGKVVGMVGTGIDIATFLRENISTEQEGTHTLFVDRDLAIQLYIDPSLIDYASITKDANQRSRFDSLLGNANEAAAVQAALQRAEKSRLGVESLAVTFQGMPHTLGITYLPELDWFDLTLIDTKDNFLTEDFFLIPMVVTGIFLLAIFTLGFLLSRGVLQPIAALNHAAQHIEKGHFDVPITLETDRKDEIGELSRAFRNMARSLQEYTTDLERKVAERTQELEKASEQLRQVNLELDQFSRTDRLTQTRNRHDLTDCLQIEASRAKRTGLPCGVIMLDFDHFKQINDHHGHQAGDTVLRELAAVIGKQLRSEDVFGRWGGEEFLILLPRTGLEEARLTAEKIRESVAASHVRLKDATVQVTVSQGLTVFDPQTTTGMDACVEYADQALYLAKSQGRDCVAVFI